LVSFNECKVRSLFYSDKTFDRFFYYFFKILLQFARSHQILSTEHIKHQCFWHQIAMEAKSAHSL
jgi:hypothetical protein